MKHVMIDLETLGTKSTSVFLSIAAVPFDPVAGCRGDAFVRNVDLQSAMDTGLTIDASTLKWWLEQRPDIMKRMFHNASELLEVMGEFHEWWNKHQFIYPWGNSASFDLKILEHGFHKVNMELPWKFYNERCYRTMAAIFPVDLPKPDEAHDPVVDCTYQIKKLQRIYRNLQL